MNDFRLIISSRLRILQQSIVSIRGLRVVTFIVVISCFLIGSYYVLFRIFGYLMTVEVIGPTLTDRIIEMAFFVFFIMLLFSNVITSFSTFYNDRELVFLFSLPVRPTSIYLAKLFENCVYASWATMVIALPLVMAYGVTTGAHALYYPLSLISIFIYLIIPAALASMLIFALFRLFPRLQSRDVIILALAFISGLTFLYVKINNPALLKIFETESERELLIFASNLTTVGGTFVPSTWLSNILKGLKVPTYGGFYYCALLVFVSCSVTIVAFFAARLLYAHSWLLIGEHTSQRKRKTSLLFSYTMSPTKTFLYKDILTFIREPTQWVQLSIFIVLLAVYVFSLRKTPIYFTFPLWRTIVSFANFAYITFVLATLGVRFIFPTVSMERAGIWVLCSSPLSFKRIITIKYLSNLVTAIIIVEGLLVFSNIVIKTDQTLYLIMPLIALFFAASLVSINLGFGSKFPQFNEDNPSKIAAGSGGIITALASIGYVGVSIIILATPAYNYLNTKYFNRPYNLTLVVLACILFLMVNAAATIVPLRIGIRSLEIRDF